MEPIFATFPADFFSLHKNQIPQVTRIYLNSILKLAAGFLIGIQSHNYLAKLSRIDDLKNEALSP